MRNLDLAPDRLRHRRACLLRAWQEGDDSHAWRFSLQNVETGERRGFADFEGLLAGLRLWLEASGAPAAGSDGAAESGPNLALPNQVAAALPALGREAMACARDYEKAPSS